ncbi:MAG: YggS family pyridoxal phosphate-dependent enzyme [Synergistota bacterium]|nr:YggS family pyridoxal phosphate-dependent enzyme [Synergistota bacterium]
MVDPVDCEVQVREVLDRMAEAALRSGRRPEDVRLLGVTKTHPVERILPVARTGLVWALGENRVQEAEGKIENWPEDLSIPWHLIGHLQRNKARKAMALFDVIHSVDSLRLAETLDRLALEFDKAPYDIMIEVNTSGEASKHGISPEETLDLLDGIFSSCGSLNPVGLMTVGPLCDDQVRIGRAFGVLRELRDRARKEFGRPLPELSMGMSGDFELAIEEGSTIVRVGSAIFGERERRQ